jgi:hypothetical protein
MRALAALYSNFNLPPLVIPVGSRPEFSRDRSVRSDIQIADVRAEDPSSREAVVVDRAVHWVCSCAAWSHVNILLCRQCLLPHAIHHAMSVVVSASIHSAIARTITSGSSTS